MPSGYIDDGYTLQGYIKELAGIYPALRFEYRPLTHGQNGKLFEYWSTISADEQTRRIGEALARQIQKWDMKGRDGRPVDCKKPAVYKMLFPPLTERILNIVCTVSTSDTDPEAGTRPSEDDSHFAESGEKNLSAAS